MGQRRRIKLLILCCVSGEACPGMKHKEKYGESGHGYESEGGIPPGGQELG